MITRLNVASIYVLDKDEALDFYVNKLGLEKGNDVRQGDYRWLTVRVPGEPGTEISLEQPGPPLHDEATAAQLRELITKGALGGLVFITDDARGLYETLKARGVTDFTQEPTEHFYGTDMGLRDPFGNADPDPPAGQGSRGGDRLRPRLRRPGRSRLAGKPVRAAAYTAGIVTGAASRRGVAATDRAARAAGLKPLAISHAAMTISCRASGAMKAPSESPNMAPERRHEVERGPHEPPGGQPPGHEPRLVEQDGEHQRAERERDDAHLLPDHRVGRAHEAGERSRIRLRAERDQQQPPERADDVDDRLDRAAEDDVAHGQRLVVPLADRPEHDRDHREREARQEDEQGADGQLVRLRGDLGVQVAGPGEDRARDDRAEDQGDRPDDVQHADRDGRAAVRTDPGFVRGAAARVFPFMSFAPMK